MKGRDFYVLIVNLSYKLLVDFFLLDELMWFLKFLIELMWLYLVFIKEGSLGVKVFVFVLFMGWVDNGRRYGSCLIMKLTLFLDCR